MVDPSMSVKWGKLGTFNIFTQSARSLNISVWPKRTALKRGVSLLLFCIDSNSGATINNSFARLVILVAAASWRTVSPSAFFCECSISQKKKIKEQYKIISQYFSQQLSWKNFISSHLSSSLTLHFYLPLSICHINKCKKFYQFLILCL